LLGVLTQNRRFVLDAIIFCTFFIEIVMIGLMYYALAFFVRWFGRYLAKITGRGAPQK
jgi:hypothetical protein